MMRGRGLATRCMKLMPESGVRVMPFFNDDAGSYVTAYRCKSCWTSSLEATRTRLENTDAEIEVASMATFFERYNVVLHEYRRGDGISVVRKRLVQMIDLQGSDAIRLPIGPDVKCGGGQPNSIDQ
jgi:hypothetical protein